ncbi:MAG: hypothetical protein GF401_00095 [Chitinivibrionales bacterium]|nr:hypothetical protein [Chitinivibrionales bacterium]
MFFILVLFLCSVCSGATVIVGEKSADFSTIQYAVNQMGAGDTVFVKEGYYDERVQCTKNSSTDPMVIIGEDSSGTIITGGFSVEGSGYYIKNFTITKGNVEFEAGADRNRVESCFLDRVDGTALYFRSGSSHNTFGKGKIYKPGNKGCELFGSYNTLEYSTIQGPTGQDGRSDSDAIRSNGGDHNVIRGNHIFHIYQVGNSHADILQFWMGFTHLTIEDNILGSWDPEGRYDPGNAHIMMACIEGEPEVDTLIIRRNIILGGSVRSFNVNNGQADRDTRLRNVFIYNNLFYTRGYAELEYMVNLEVKNNIFYCTNDINERPGYRLRGNVDEDVNYNCIYPAGHDEPDGIRRDPLFVDDNLYRGDFHLTAESPCIDAGTRVGLEEDMEGAGIVNKPDIGPYEFVSEATSADTDMSSLLTIKKVTRGRSFVAGMEPRNLIVDAKTYDVLGRMMYTKLLNDKNMAPLIMYRMMTDIKK